MTEKSPTLVRRPEELVYRSCYAPADLREMLGSAETRSRIRRLPAPHLYFGLQELDDEECRRLLPHITEEQWTVVLDLDLWSKDQASVGQFLHRQYSMVESADAVARKLIRGADPELWELTFKRWLRVYSRVEEEMQGEPPEGEWLETPDGHYMVVFPRDAEKARLARALLLRLYELEPAWAALLLETSRARTAVEIEESAYQKRKRRIEDLGFQDYYDAIEVYTYLPPDTRLPAKSWDPMREMNLLPVKLPGHENGPLLLFRAFANLTRQQEIQPLLEELFYVCNRVLSADRISAADPGAVKRAIRKAITGINLGLDWWSKGDLNQASEGVIHHYLQSFFQAGYSRLLELQRQAQKIQLSSAPEPGSLLEAVLQALLRRYPMTVEEKQGRLRRRFCRTREDLQALEEHLSGLAP